MILNDLLVNKKENNFISFLDYQKPGSAPLQSTLFLKNRRTRFFFTEDSGLYISPKQQEMINEDNFLNLRIRDFDSVSRRIIKRYREVRPNSEDIFYRELNKRYAKIKECVANNCEVAFGKLSPVRVWNLSIVGAIILGMASMTFIYKFLGPGVQAGKNSDVKIAAQPEIEPQVLGAATEKKDEQDIAGYVEEIIDSETKEKEELEEEISGMVKGYPIEKMVPYIAEKDRTVAAFLIGIAKKESNWGIHVPRLNGQDCFNYWGYRGQRKLMGTGGHTCFNSSKDAVDTVAKRIEWLVKNNKLNTPAKMVIWKCGSECHKDSQAAVRKWISDVGLYFNKLND